MLILNGLSRPEEDAGRDIFAEAIVLGSLRLAETDEALTRLEELLATHISEIVECYEENKSAGVHAIGVEKAEEAQESIRKDGQEVMERFKDARRTQRRQNQQLAKVKMTCEALLTGKWLSANIGSLVDAFNAEPAAFVFSSTVPFVPPEAPKKPAAPGVSSPPPAIKPKKEDDGIFRSLFRWLFG